MRGEDVEPAGQGATRRRERQTKGGALASALSHLRVATCCTSGASASQTVRSSACRSCQRSVWKESIVMSVGVDAVVIHGCIVAAWAAPCVAPDALSLKKIGDVDALRSAGALRKAWHRHFPLGTKLTPVGPVVDDNVCTLSAQAEARSRC